MTYLYNGFLVCLIIAKLIGLPISWGLLVIIGISPLIGMMIYVIIYEEWRSTFRGIQREEAERQKLPIENNPGLFLEKTLKNYLQDTKVNKKRNS